jgi:hypothetical protein
VVELYQLPSAGEFPHTHRVVVAAGGELAPVVAEGDSIDRARVVELYQLPSAGEFPHADLVVVAAGGEVGDIDECCRHMTRGGERRSPAPTAGGWPAQSSGWQRRHGGKS